MIEPTMTELTTEILDNLPIKKIIYAECAQPYAMGKGGGVIIYIITGNTLNCYKTNIYKDKNAYYKAVDALKKNGILNFYEGMLGSNVFINSSTSLKIADSYFIYKKNFKRYKIYSSVQGVFYSVVYAICRDLRHKKHFKFDDCKDYEEEERKQKEKLQKKLDKKIIVGKTYTEKEINVILKMCCTSQDHVSFRRELIDKGYLHRTNDCKSYWRNG